MAFALYCPVYTKIATFGRIYTAFWCTVFCHLLGLVLGNGIHTVKPEDCSFSQEGWKSM